ncbi:MAG: hypothetical protein HKN80_04150 [Acidimicrobiia bacterium]|nr:hypothetical protein [Gemmatimonadota bacterium]NNC91664.1 hypothetical protein [Acidimicrobiia bacterium]
MRYVALLAALVLVVAACGDSEGGADPERFCEILDELDTQNTSGMPADEALPIIQEGRDKYVEGIEVAPDEIRADAETFANFVIEITDLLIAAGGDESQVDVADIDAIDDDGVDAAAQSVGAWRTSNCS